MAIFYVGYTKTDDTFVPQTPVELGDMGRGPQLQDVYVGGGVVREVVGIMENGSIMTALHEGEVCNQALKHLWDSEEEE